MRNILIIVIVIVAVAALVVVPVPHTFAAQIYTPALLNQGNATFFPPSGATVSGKWSAPDPTTNFQIRINSALGGDVFSGQGANGSFGFTASQYEYWFVTGAGSAETVDVSGSYSSAVV